MYFKSGKHREAGLRYSAFKALVAPRPIGWISTISEDGIANLAPYSFFNGISELPPMVMFVSAPDVRPDLPTPHQHQAKDSLANIRQSGEFGVNIVGVKQIDEMMISSQNMPADRDEFDAAGLVKKQARDIKAPLVAGAPAHLECSLYDMIELPGSPNRAGCVMVLGHVISMHIDDAVITDGLVDVTKFQPVMRLGYKDYSHITDIYQK